MADNKEQEQQDDSDTDDGLNGIIVDNGGYTVKAGFSGDQAPRVQMPCVVCPSAHDAKSGRVGAKAMELGTENGKGLRYPVERGNIKGWGDMVRIWNDIFCEQLRIDTSEHPILMTEKALTAKGKREKLIDIIFEKFNVPGYYVSEQATLSLYSCGRTTGMTLDVGYDTTFAVPVYEGYALPHAVLRLKLGGKHLTNLLKTQLALNDGTFKQFQVYFVYIFGLICFPFSPLSSIYKRKAVC